ncbi:MAG: flagellar protein FlaG [Pseudomonadota bacterium]
MNDPTAISASQNSARLLEAGARRAEGLAEARRTARESQLASAEQSRADQAAQIAEAREIIARAVGANTRLSIERRADASTFVYRAIDQATGEVIQEWPPEQFAEAVRQASRNGAQPQAAAAPAPSAAPASVTSSPPSSPAPVAQADEAAPAARDADAAAQSASQSAAPENLNGSQEVAAGLIVDAEV